MIFIETPLFIEAAQELLSDEAMTQLFQTLQRRPGAGAIIKETGGIRKLRLALAGRGKSGGARVIYYWRVSESQIFLLDIYAKNEQSDLNAKQKEALRKLVKEWLS